MSDDSMLQWHLAARETAARRERQGLLLLVWWEENIPRWAEKARQDNSSVPEFLTRGDVEFALLQGLMREAEEVMGR